MKIHLNDKIELLGKSYVKSAVSPCFKCIVVNGDLLDFTIADGYTVCEFCNQYCAYLEYPVLRKL